MTSLIYFDPDELKQGRYFEIDDTLVAEDGRTYILGDWLARGGNGSVFRCVERSSGTEYAVKFLMFPRGKVLQRFFREVRLLKELKHEHIVRYRGTGKTRHIQNSRGIRCPFLVMELAESSLSDFAKSSPIAPEIYVGQFRGLARGLADLHAKAVHRDIKPENILISGDRWLLSDYGLCRFSDRPELDLTPNEQAIGPKYWLSPEAHNRRLGQGDVICPASDVYQLASVFWYVATGRHPSGIITQDDWTGPEWLFSPIQQALQHGKGRRPADGVAFAAAIEAAVGA
ncbi:serine/threonine-protein kinase [Altererythrobacter sp. H2]|uniref:serine/threonine-protein kinase n=1 Tax=Altererythrobacter sp. H2 TaxID=3108391 RepID=UPI002B4C1303|nr:serine/threonine-protein kinase [Altererythrobacter sp. H2]WRK94454.1 serine/threonine-protein kinase [Altererythrobacter sp. H2]